MTVSTSLLGGGLVLATPHSDDETIEPLVESLARRVMEQPVTDTGHWQALKDVPQTATREIRNAVVQVYPPATKEAWEAFCCANQPWAERQFRERVAGDPVNPGVTYKEWPWYRGNVDKHRKCKSCGQAADEHDFGVCPGYFEEPQFSHTYMERFWPAFAHSPAQGNDHELRRYGIRYRYGDLNDVLDLLAREPYTRQAYFGMWHPEDNGAAHGERVPCSLGWHFMLREGRLHCFYPIRSCDLLRHFKDDVYMSGRLVQWVIGRLQDRTDDQPGEAAVLWGRVVPGDLTLFIPSLHCFDGDMPALRRKYG